MAFPLSAGAETAPIPVKVLTFNIWYGGDQGVPVILTGDFNSPSWRDWQGRSPAVKWPVSDAPEEAGFAVK
jgi:hypothetical protein